MSQIWGLGLFPSGRKTLSFCFTRNFFNEQRALTLPSCLGHSTCLCRISINLKLLHSSNRHTLDFYDLTFTQRFSNYGAYAAGGTWAHMFYVSATTVYVWFEY